MEIFSQTRNGRRKLPANLANDASPRCSEDSVGDVAFSYRFSFERKFHSKILVEKIRQIFFLQCFFTRQLIMSSDFIF